LQEKKNHLKKNNKKSFSLDVLIKELQHHTFFWYSSKRSSYHFDDTVIEVLMYKTGSRVP